MKRRFLLSACLFVIFAGSAAAQGYKAIDLYTLDTSDYGGHVTFSVNVGAHFGAVADGELVVGQGITSLIHDAVLWSGPNGTAIDLHPTSLEFSRSFAVATDGVQQVGSGRTMLGEPHAVLWDGTANSAIDLHPTNLTNFTSSEAYGINGSQQVGYGIPVQDNYRHALLWNGTAGTAVDLNPTNLTVFNTTAVGVGDGQQVGFGTHLEINPFGNYDATHALLWNGTANSAVDLDPINLHSFGQDSYALATSANQQVGYYGVDGGGGAYHAILWKGTGDSAVDLNPTNLGNVYDSFAQATNGIRQVGYGSGDATGGFGNNHAFVWNGTADSAIDLHQFLSADFNTSLAYSINAQGNVFGLAYDLQGRKHAIEWVPVPEPSSLMLLMIASAVWCLRRRRAAW